MIEKPDTEFNGAPVYDASSVNSSLSRIRNTLNYSLKKKYGIEDPQITEQFMKIHGLDKQRFEFISNFEHLIENGIATDSVDSNSNKGSVSTAGLLVETALPINKLIGYRYLYRKMNELYGKKRAKFLSGEMYDESIAIADSTALLRPYCFSINAQKLVLEGRPWGAAPSLPPHRVGSYIAALCETIHQLSNHLAGAIAVGSFFFDIAHLILNKEKRTLGDVKNDPVYRKYIENSLQSFVHSVNHLSRNSTESPFSNISIFDRPKIKGMIEQYFDWYFDYDDVNPRVKEECPDESGWLEYVMNIVLEVQEIYMEVMDRGDVLHDGRQFTFPVSTVNISKKKINDGSYEIEDPEFLDNFCKKHDVVRYNIYTAVGEKIASCCRLVNDLELFSMGGQVNSFGGTGLSLGSHRVATINLRRIAPECNSFDDYLSRLKNRMDSAADILIAHRALLKDLVKKGVEPFVENGWLDLDKMFSTFGIMGYYEAVEDLKKRFGEGMDYLKEILVFINDYARELTKERKNIFNIEQVPGESMCARLADADRYLFGKELVPEEIYANQFLPNTIPGHTLWEKMEVEGKYGDLLTGGGICHFNVGEKITGNQAKTIIKYAVKVGCEHFAINTVYSICENEHWTLGEVDKCPQCGKDIIDHATRVVGFLTRTSDWSKKKKLYDFDKRTYGDLEGKPLK